MGDNFLGKLDARHAFSGRIADLSGGSANQHNRLVSCQLEMTHGHDRQKMSDMKTVAGGVKADVIIYRTFGEKLFNGFFGSVLVNEPAGFQVLKGARRHFLHLS